MQYDADIVEYEWNENPRFFSVARDFIDHLKERPLLLAAGGLSVAILIGGVIYTAVVTTGDNVVIYVAEGDGAGEFRHVGERIAANIGAALYPARNAQDVLDAVRRYRRIKNLIMVGHGTTTQYMRPGHSGIRVGDDQLPTWMSHRTFAREVGPRMAAGGWIGWAGCSSASNPGESGWSSASYEDGGERSFIAQVRDEMAQTPGVLWGIEHGGHTAPGHVSANPGARECPVSRSAIGQPCESVMEETWGSGANYNSWVSAFQGVPAETWISTGAVVV
jgi:hypothetical protein